MEPDNKQIVELKLKELSFNIRKDIDDRKKAFEGLIDATKKKAILEKGVKNGGLSEGDQLNLIDQRVAKVLHELALSANQEIVRLMEQFKQEGLI